MNKYIFFLCILHSTSCFSQNVKWQISGGLGLSGVNQVIKNDVNFDGRVRFNRKNNLLDNKFRNDALHTDYVQLSKYFENGFLTDYNIALSLAMNNFRSIYYKEDKFELTFPNTTNDTINSPNWLFAKYTLPYADFAFSRQIKINSIFLLEVGLFLSYQIDYYGTSHLILFDSNYIQWERHTFASAKDFTNFEFDHFNYGLRLSASICSTKRLHPVITWTQSLNDISREKFHLYQHANIWALDVGLTYNLSERRSKIITKNTPHHRAQDLIKYSVSLNYVYAMKWNDWRRRADNFYYYDIPRNHTGSIQGDALLHIGRFLSSKKGRWDDLSIGTSSELIYLPFSGLHYVDFTYLGKINGLDQWVHHYDHDRYQFIYMVNGIKARYEIKNAGFVSFMKAYPIILHQSAQTQDLFLNNKTGAYTYSPWEERSTDLTRNPHIFTEVIIGIKMLEKQYFTFGFQWTARSSFVQFNDNVDNRHQAFRNVKIGWQISL